MEAWIELGFSSTPEAAWETLIGHYGDGLKSRVRRALRRAGERPRGDQIEEIVQEVYCRLLAGDSWRLRQCRATSRYQVSAFLGRVAERVALDHVRAARAKKRGGRAVQCGDDGRREESGGRQGADAAAEHGGAGEGEPRQLADPCANPEERMLDRERTRLFLYRCSALAGGRAARRNVRILTLAWNGWTSREIARLLGGRVTQRGVEGLLRRLRRRAAVRSCRRARPCTETL